MKTHGADGWTRAFYETPALAAVLVEEGELLDQALACLTRELGLRGGERLLDQCCGAGGIALALAERGHPVVGVDISAPFVERARARAAARGLPCTFARADATRWQADAPCDAGFNWATGFGCFADDAANQAMLARAAASLRPDAPFLLDYYNVAGVLADFKPSFTYAREVDGRAVEVTRASTLDLARGLLHQRWRLVDGDAVAEPPPTTTRLYLAADLVRLLEGAGFAVERVLGDADGGALDLASPRCVVVARRR